MNRLARDVKNRIVTESGVLLEARLIAMPREGLPAVCGKQSTMEGASAIFRSYVKVWDCIVFQTLLFKAG